MSQKAKDRIIFAGLIIVKILATVRTGVDMWMLTHDLLNVLLLDGMMLAFWLVAAYGGSSKQAMAIRPLAAAGTWLLYGAQVYVGWAAHETVIAFLVRLAPGLALFYDTAEYLVALIHRKGERSRAERRAWLRGIISDTGYYVTAVALAPVQWAVQVAVLFRDVIRDTRTSFVTVTPAHATPHASVPSPTPDPARALSTEERRARVADLHEAHTVTDLADKLGVSRKTIYRDLKVIGANGYS